jgi:hypothetical protein
MEHTLFFRLCALAALCIPALAQRYEAGVFGAYEKSKRENLGTLFSSNAGLNSDTELGNGNGYGVRLTLNTEGYHGLEFSYSRTRLPFRTQLLVDPEEETFEAYDERLRTTIFSGNWLFYFMPRDEKWRPYFTFGAHAQNYRKPVVGRIVEGGEDTDDVFIPFFPGTSSRKIGFNYGAGIKLRPAGPVLFRFDFRHYYNGNPFQADLMAAQGTPIQQQFLPGRLKQMEFSAGISFAFGF